MATNNRIRKPGDGKVEDMPDEQLCACFTGHRPKTFKWGYNERDERCVALKQKLRNEIKRLYGIGFRYFISGMAEGVDTFAAEAVLGLTGELEDIRLICVFPYGNGNSTRQRNIAYSSYGVLSLNREHVPGCMAERNRFMVNHSNHIVCVFSGDTHSGTYSTMCMARQRGIAMTVIGI